MKTTKQARRDAKQLFRSCVKSGLLDESCVREAVKQLVEKKPRGYVGILAHFQRLVELDIERRAARIESALPLTPDHQSTVKQNLTRVYGGGLTFTFSENPALIGGLRIKIGSDVYDGTVRGRLDRLQESF